MAIPSITMPLSPTSTAKTAATDSTSHVAKNSDATAAALPSLPDAASVTAAEQARSQDQINQAVEHIRESVAPMARNLQFSLDSDTGQTVVKVVDTSTNEVIRQIPSEEVLDLAKTLDKVTGLLLKQKA